MRDIALIRRHDFKKGRHIRKYELMMLDAGDYCVKDYWEYYLDENDVANQDFTAWEIRFSPTGNLFNAVEETGTKEVFLPLMDEIATEAKKHNCDNSFFAVFNVSYDSYYNYGDWCYDYETNVEFIGILDTESLAVYA